VDQLSHELRKDIKLTACITLKIRYSNFETFTKQIRIPYTNSEQELSKKAMDLFTKLFSRRMLIRMIGIKFSELRTGCYQIDLFNDGMNDINLSAAMDKIRMRFGLTSVKRAVVL